MGSAVARGWLLLGVVLAPGPYCCWRVVVLPAGLAAADGSFSAPPAGRPQPLTKVILIIYNSSV